MSILGEAAVLAALEAQIARIRANAEAAAGEIAAALEGWAKSEHVYTDRTGNTTTSIRGQVTEVSADIVRVVISAGMNYDKWLELCHDGKWAFLLPTIERHKEDIIAMLEARLRL